MKQVCCIRELRRPRRAAPPPPICLDRRRAKINRREWSRHRALYLPIYLLNSCFMKPNRAVRRQLLHFVLSSI